MLRFTFLAAGLIAAAFVWSGSAPTGRTGAAISTPQDLVGMSANDVLRTLGPPIRIHAGRDLATWIYPTAAGEPIQEAVWIAGDCVIRVDETVPLPREDRGIPAEGAYLGQHVRELVTRLGQPEKDTIVGSISIRIRFGDRSVELAGGRVCGIIPHR